MKDNSARVTTVKVSKFQVIVQADTEKNFKPKTKPNKILSTLLVSYTPQQLVSF